MAVKFEIYQEGNRQTAFTPVAAMAMGPESVPIPGEVTFKDGLLHVMRSDDAAVGASLLWDLGAMGAYQMETTRLPPREKPYNLNLELARFRLMKIIQKQEDWNLFDFPKADKVNQRFKEAQNLFSDALAKMEDAPEASKLADQSLAIAVELSEQLASFHSELLINRRRASNSFVKHIFGSRVDSSVQNTRYKESLAGNFDYAVVPMSWKQIAPEEGAFNTEALDEWVETLSRKKVPIIAGPLIDLNEGQVPDWLFIWEHDFDTLRDLAFEFVQKVVHRYRKAVAVWNVCSGFHTNRAFTFTFEQIIELTRLLVAHVKTMLPQARTLISITQPFGEYHASPRTSVPPMLYAEMVAQAGINFEAFGLEMEFGVPRPGGYMRDLFQVSCMLDRFSTLGRPLFLTGISAPGRPSVDSTDASEGRLDPALGGRWKREWDPALQAEFLEAVYRVALSKPFVESIAWGNLADIGHTLPGGGLMDDMMQPKPVYEALKSSRAVSSVDRPQERIEGQAMSGTIREFRRRGNWIWTARQRVTLSIVVLILLGGLAIKLFLNRGFVADPQPVIGERHLDLASRIDPNTADWPGLAALPNIGEKRAKDIVAYREEFWRKRPGEPAFTKVEDLMEVKGIGKVIAEGLREWLVFPATPSK